MNATPVEPGEHIVYLALGSNIDPLENLRRAIQMLGESMRVQALSTCWETAAIIPPAAVLQPAARTRPAAAGQPAQPAAPNFYNLGMCAVTRQEREALKNDTLRPIESALGRVRGADKYAPRTIDLDITVFDGQVVDAEVWRRLYLALIFAEMLPELRNPETGETPAQAAARLAPGKLAIPHPELFAPK